MGPAARGRVVGLLVLDSLVVQSALAQAGRAPVAPRAPHQLQLPAFLSAPTARHPLLPPGGCRAQGPAGPRGARPPASNRLMHLRCPSLGMGTSEPGAGAGAGAGGKKKKAKKRRVDELLVEQGLAHDAKHAAALVMTGAVIADDSTRIDSAGAKVAEDTPFRLKGQKAHPWVSRGGMKLDHAIQEFALDVSGRVAIDVGCSTGGFTHVLLHHGASKVYAVDVGYGQLALQLRDDPRVAVLERTNARQINQTVIPSAPNLVVCDASFIPLHKVLPASLALCRAPATLLALIKPQFEAERHEVESGTGVVRDSEVHDRVCSEVQTWLQRQGWEVKGLTKSPITGPNGNVEFIVWAQLMATSPEATVATAAASDAEDSQGGQ